MLEFNWTQMGPTVLAAFIASLVEFVEALTIVLAVGVTRGWSGAFVGTAAALGSLVVIVAALGPALQFIPVEVLQLIIGILLLLFGMRWLRKAILRAGGVIPLHDETEAYETEIGSLRKFMRPGGRWDGIAILTSFKAVFLEGIEVVFIVVALGATGKALVAASIGASAAGAAVILLGLFIHRPLSLVPENTLKFAVGVVLSSYGVFWVGEAYHTAWPGGDTAILGIAFVFLVVGLMNVWLLRQRRAGARR